jgi:hypothetical protein
MDASYIPVRKMHPYNRISVRLLNTDGTEPPAGTPALSADQYPESLLTDKRYKLYDTRIKARLTKNLYWLSDNHPLLFEELLSFLEDMRMDYAPSMANLLDHHLVPDGKCTESYVLTYYRLAMDMLELCASLAAEGFIGSKDTRAWGLFGSARTACGFTVEHPHYKEVILAVWIMQDKHHVLNDPLRAKNHKQDLDFISQRFDEVYNLRHELRKRSTIDMSTIEVLLQHKGPLQSGCL